MKNFIVFFAIVLSVFCKYSQTTSEIAEASLGTEVNLQVSKGSKFVSFPTGINSKYADYGIGFFMDKFITFSARKIGGFAKKDPRTLEPFTKLYCSDIKEDWDLTRPLLFSSILNKNENLGSLTFSLDGQTLFFTKSSEEESDRFELYSAELNPERQGEWINITPVSFNGENYSIETPHLRKDGKRLYFSANMPDGVGGFDIYYVDLNKDGTLKSNVVLLPGDLNTEADEKYPYTSLDDKFLYFSSNGHQAYGGYDVFKSRVSVEGYKLIINLGSSINTEKDEIGFIPATETIAYITSNREGGYGNYDVYKVIEFSIEQQVSGKTLDLETGIPLANVAVSLIDTEGEEVATVMSNEVGEYTFPINSFEYYTVLASKDGFLKGVTIFNSDNSTPNFEVDVTLKAKAAEIVETAEKAYIKIDNIQFDYDSDRIKEVSTITLNTVVQTLSQNPEIKVSLNAHTDTQGSAGYNLKLSDRRAASAMKYLIEKGVSPNRLISKGYGETQPLVDCVSCSEQQHEANRRIEFIIIE